MKKTKRMAKIVSVFLAFALIVSVLALPGTFAAAALTTGGAEFPANRGINPFIAYSFNPYLRAYDYGTSDAAAEITGAPGRWPGQVTYNDNGWMRIQSRTAEQEAAGQDSRTARQWQWYGRFTPDFIDQFLAAVDVMRPSERGTGNFQMLAYLAESEVSWGPGTATGLFDCWNMYFRDTEGVSLEIFLEWQASMTPGGPWLDMPATRISDVPVSNFNTYTPLTMAWGHTFEEMIDNGLYVRPVGLGINMQRYDIPDFGPIHHSFRGIRNLDLYFSPLFVQPANPEDTHLGAPAAINMQNFRTQSWGFDGAAGSAEFNRRLDPDEWNFAPGPGGTGPYGTGNDIIRHGVTGLMFTDYATFTPQRENGDWYYPVPSMLIPPDVAPPPIENVQTSQFMFDTIVTWDAEELAERYEIRVTPDVAGTVVRSETNSVIISGYVLTLRDPFPYTVQVRGINTNHRTGIERFGEWSTAHQFTILPEPVIVCPGHIWGDPVANETNGPTCWQAGYGTAVCEVCEGYDNAVPMDPTGDHNLVDNRAILGTGNCYYYPNTAYFCDTDGCTQHGAVTIGEQRDEPAHAWGNVVPNPGYEPTCFEPGVGTAKCELCDYDSDSAVIPPTGDHVFADNQEIPGTGDCMTYPDTANFCTTPGCTAHDTIIPGGPIDGGSHTWAGTATEVPGTGDCFYYPDTAYFCTECSAYDDTRVIVGVQRDVPAHVWGDVIVNPGYEPTCTAAGVGTKTCENCPAYVDDVEIAMTDHNWQAIAARPATCVAAGNAAGQRCADCNRTEGAEVIPVLGHAFVATPARAATCTVAGVAAGQRCTRCPVTTGGAVAPARGHSPAPAGNRNATFFATGIAGRTACRTCNQVLAAGRTVARRTLGRARITLRATGNRRVRVTTNRVANANRYQFQFRRQGQRAWRNGGFVSGRNRNIARLTRGRNYQFRVRAARVQGRQRANGAWSVARRIRVR